MEVFNLKKNEIGLQGIKSLEDCFALSKTIKELNLSGNNIGDEGVSIVIRSDDQSKIDDCNLQILEFVNEKKIEVVDR